MIQRIIKFGKCEYRIFLCSELLLSVIIDNNIVTYLRIKYHNTCIYSKLLYTETD